VHAVLRSLRPPRWARTLMSRASGLASLRLALDGVLRDLAGVFAGVKKLKPNRLIFDSSTSPWPLRFRPFERSVAV